MKKLSLELRVGLFAVIAVLLVLIFAVIKGQFVFRRGGYEIKAVFKYVAGIDRGSPVRVSGVGVGEVKKVVIDYTDAPRVFLTLHLDRSVKLGHHSQVLIRSFGLIGEKYVEILPAPTSDTPLIQPGEVLTGVEPLPIDRLLAMGEDLGRSIKEMVTSLDKIFGDPKFKTELFETMEKIKILSAQGSQTLAGVESSAAKLGAASGKAERLLTSLQNTMEQGQPAIVQSLLNFQIASAGLASASKQLTKIINQTQSDDSSLGLLISSPDLYRKLDRSLVDLEKSAAQFAQAAKDVELLSGNLKSGKGSVGKLLTSDELYEQVKGLVTEIRAKPWRLFRPDHK